MSLNAFVTLVTTDSYVPGALVTINSVLEIEGQNPDNPFETVCLVTPATVSVESIKALRGNFSLVVGVEELRSGSNTELQLLGNLLAFFFVDSPEYLSIVADIVLILPS